MVILSPKFKGFAVFAALLALTPIACRKEAQAVKGVEQNALSAEQKAQANATELDSERAELAKIPLPTKSMYVDVHEPAQWTNPFLSVGPEYVTMRVVHADANPTTITQGTFLRPDAARHQDMQLRLTDLDQAVLAIPADAWHYGRVIAVEESPDAPAKDRPKVRRNVETVIRRLNDLGVVVEEWPAR